MAEEIAKPKQMNTNLSIWTNQVTGLVVHDFEECGVTCDEYAKACAMNAMSTIYQLVKSTDKADLSQLDTSNLREVVGQVASLKLNANTIPAECYFQLRSKQVNGQWVKIVEMGLLGNGYDAMLRNFGVGVAQVWPCWLVHEGDEFTFPKHRGVEVTPPEWEEKGLSPKVIRVVYPVKMQDGTVQYLIAERDSVKVNLLAHVRNNLMNETFGIAESRYKASDKQKKEIAAKKAEILDALRQCETLEDMLNCPEARPYMSGAWIDTPEEMIVRKMRNNAIKKFPKDLNRMARQSYMQMDETYVQARQEIEENQNSEEFTIDGEAEVQDVEVQAE